jgi:signal transduction histidine kinase
MIHRLSEPEIEQTHADHAVTMEQLLDLITYEISNPIGATIINAQAALRFLNGQPPDLEELRQALARIVRDGNRARDLIIELRALMQKTPP